MFEILNRIQVARAKEDVEETTTLTLKEEVPSSRPGTEDGQDSRALDLQIPPLKKKQTLRRNVVEPDDQRHTKLSAEQWLMALRDEYVCSYMKQGGSSIKFAVTDGASSHKVLHQKLHYLAKAEGVLFVKADARFTKLHLVDRLFFKVAKQIDWDKLAYNFVRQLIIEKGYQVPAHPADFNLQQLASLNNRREALFWRDLQTWLEQDLERDSSLCREFRMAMLYLCLAQFQAGESDLQLAQAIKEWLHGELGLISSVKKALIFQKIGRHNARFLLTSLTHWVKRTGKSGILITLDIARYLVPKPSTQSDSNFYYTPSAVLDVYDALRQFIDGMNGMTACLMVVLAPPSFLTDARRGLDRYEALKLRIWDDVRDKLTPNPLAPMVRLASVNDEIGGDQSAAVAMTTTLNPDQYVNRQVIEGLRAGVPNQHVIRALGCYQPEVEGYFQGILQTAKEKARQGRTAKGMIVQGGFGTGKSHVLEYLQDFAMQQSCICSRIVISKETPLYNPTKVFTEALSSARVPGKMGQALSEMVEGLDVRSREFQHLVQWVHDSANGIDQRFAATVFLFQRMGSDPELRHRVIRFWNGEPISMADVRSYLRECGVPKRYSFPKIKEPDLAVQRFRFMARLMQTAGYSSWVLFIDEAELIGRYAFSQRVKSYAELARWLGVSCEIGIPGIVSVVALTDDFQSEILEHKGDRARVLDSLGQVGSRAVIEKHAEEGIRCIEWDAKPLRALAPERIEEAYHRIRNLHQSVYARINGVSDEKYMVQPVSFPRSRMRECVKGWVTEWDLKRVLHQENVDLEVRSVKQEYQEDQTLESSSEEETNP